MRSEFVKTLPPDEQKFLDVIDQFFEQNIDHFLAYFVLRDIQKVLNKKNSSLSVELQTMENSSDPDLRFQAQRNVVGHLDEITDLLDTHNVLIRKLFPTELNAFEDTRTFEASMKSDSLQITSEAVRGLLVAMTGKVLEESKKIFADANIGNEIRLEKYVNKRLKLHAKTELKAQPIPDQWYAALLYKYQANKLEKAGQELMQARRELVLHKQMKDPSELKFDELKPASLKTKFKKHFSDEFRDVYKETKAFEKKLMELEQKVQMLEAKWQETKKATETVIESIKPHLDKKDLAELEQKEKQKEKKGSFSSGKDSPSASPRHSVESTSSSSSPSSSPRHSFDSTLGSSSSPTLFARPLKNPFIGPIYNQLVDEIKNSDYTPVQKESLLSDLKEYKTDLEKRSDIASEMEIRRDFTMTLRNLTQRIAKKGPGPGP